MWRHFASKRVRDNSLTALYTVRFVLAAFYPLELPLPTALFRSRHCLLWTHAQRASMLYFADVFLCFFMTALVGQTAERIFTKLAHVVDIRCYL